MFESSRPERCMNGRRPTVGSIKEGSTSTSSDILNATFSLTILMVSIDATKGKGLVGTCNRSMEGRRIKESIVSMIMANSDRVGLGKVLKGKLGSNSGVGIHLGHEVDIGEVQKMINKDSCAKITLKCGTTLMGRNIARDRTNQLIHADNVSRMGSLTDVMTIVRATGLPRSAMRFAISTARTHRRRDRGQVRRNNASTCKKS